MSETYESDSIFVAYAKWHYGRGLGEFLAVAGNFLWFVTNFFSFKLLLKTLFAPWKRLGEHYGDGFDLSAWASSFIVNSLMRTVGFVTRLLVLLVGLVSYILVGTSRLYLGVHYLSDVLVGYAIGFVWLLLSIKLHKYILRFFGSIGSYHFKS